MSHVWSCCKPGNTVYSVDTTHVVNCKQPAVNKIYYLEKELSILIIVNNKCN